MSSTGTSSKVLLTLGIGLGVTVVSGAACWYYHDWKKKNAIPKKWRRVGVLEQINIFPVKSCARLELQPNTEVVCETLGLRLDGCHDRALMVIDDDNQMVTARVYPKMVLIKTKLMNGTILELSAPQMETIQLDLASLPSLNGTKVATTVWSTKMHVRRCGAQYDKWVSKFLLDKGKGLNLVYYQLDKPVRAINSRMVKEPFIRGTDRGTFNDATSYMLMNLSSINDLNKRIPRPVDPLQFRGSFHLKMDRDEPYAEDNWGWVKIGEDAIFRVAAPCTRCIFPNINVITAERDPDGEPLKTLKGYRQFEGYASPALGIHLGLRQKGSIQKSNIIYVEDK